MLDKENFDDGDSVMVNGAVDLPCAAFAQLRSGQRLDMWIIAAAMELIDKPLYVRYGYSVPLDDLDENGNIFSIQQPLARWRKKIDEWREVENDRTMIYFCPLNIGTNHFSLLEINEQLSMIYHYNSLADPDVIEGRNQPTQVEHAVKVSQAQRHGIWSLSY